MGGQLKIGQSERRTVRSLESDRSRPDLSSFGLLGLQVDLELFPPLEVGLEPAPLLDNLLGGFLLTGNENRDGVGGEAATGSGGRGHVEVPVQRDVRVDVLNPGHEKKSL